MKVLDASAAVALALGEPGSEKVGDAIRGSVMSAINVSEFLTALTRNGFSLQEAIDDFDSLPIMVIPFDRSIAIGSATLIPKTRSLGLSLADRACIATGQSLEATIITTDRAWADLKVGVEIQVIR